MSDQGFHEIQLSGKQLVFLFMSAVVLAVVIFLLGVNVGRGVRNAVGDTPISAEADSPEPAVPADAAGAEPAKAAEPELSYHEMLLGEGTAPVPTPATEPPATEPPAKDPTAKDPAVKVPAQPPAETAPAPVQESAQQPATSGGWFLQTGAFATLPVAESQVAKLKQLDVPAFVLQPGAGGPTKFFRVRIGPYAERAEAEQISNRLTRQGFTPSITR